MDLDGSYFTDNQLLGKRSIRKDLASDHRTLKMWPKYERTIQEFKTCWPMLCITVIAFRSTAVIDNILKEIVKERTIFLNLPQYMKWRVKLPNMCVGVVGYKEGDDGDGNIAEEEGGGRVGL